MKKWLTGCLEGGVTLGHSLHRPPSPTRRPFPNGQLSVGSSSGVGTNSGLLSSGRRPLKGILKKSPSDGLEGSYSPTPVGRYRYWPPSRRPRLVSAGAGLTAQPSRRRPLDLDRRLPYPPRRPADFRKRQIEDEFSALNCSSTRRRAFIRRNSLDLGRLHVNYGRLGASSAQTQPLGYRKRPFNLERAGCDLIRPGQKGVEGHRVSSEGLQNNPGQLFNDKNNQPARSGFPQPQELQRQPWSDAPRRRHVPWPRHSHRNNPERPVRALTSSQPRLWRPDCRQPRSWRSDTTLGLSWLPRRQPVGGFSLPVSVAASRDFDPSSRSSSPPEKRFAASPEGRTCRRSSASTASLPSSHSHRRRIRFPPTTYFADQQIDTAWEDSLRTMGPRYCIQEREIGPRYCAQERESPGRNTATLRQLQQQYHYQQRRASWTHQRPLPIRPRQQDTDRKREAFYELLANRYPQYADKITGLAAYHQQQPNTAAERAPRSREPQRRRTTTVTYNPLCHRLDYEDPGTMSDVELSSFQRGGYARASLPIVRSASTSLERPIGLVFLVYRDETKKALLPNEITSLDTVRALFVRAFPDKLSMEYLDSAKRKIYIFETATSIFFQLEDLRDIQDRTVLKIHECESHEPQRVRAPPEVRGRVGQPAVATSRPASRQGFAGESSQMFREEMAKAQSIPLSAAHNYQDLLHKERALWDLEQQQQEYMQAQQRRSRSRSQTPEPAERPRSLSTGGGRSRYSHSPDRAPTPDRGPPPPLNPIPENPRMLANGFRDAAMNGGHYEPLSAAHSAHPHHPQSAQPPPPGRVLSPPPPGMGQPIYESIYQAGGYPHPQAYVSHSTRAPLPQGPQRATGPPPPDMRGNPRGGPPNRHSLAFAAMSNPIYESFPQRTQSYRMTPERDVLPPRPQSAQPHEMHRMERMEAQIASLAAWVHQVQASPTEPVRRGPGSSRSTSSSHSEGTDTYPGSSASKENGDFSCPTSGLSDIPTAYTVPRPVVTSDMREKINDMLCRMREFRVELQGLRRMEQLNQEAMREAFSDTLAKVKMVMGAVPGADSQLIRYQRFEVNSIAEAYLLDKAKVEKELSDLETSVEELKADVIAKRCRINVSDVEGLALLLSNITKSLADLKVRFPQVHESLRKVMAGEMEVVVKEEKFVKEEPLQIEAALKRCKKLTNTLYTLKRLATMQDSRPPQVPSLALESKEVGDHEKMAILENIRAMVPDHETRVQCLEAAESSRERKKKLITQQETLKFTKSLQTASKALKPADPQVKAKVRAEGESEAKRSKAVVIIDPLSVRRSSEPPMVPAKPARLLSASEVKSGAGYQEFDTSPAPPVSPLTPTVLVTGQMAEASGDRKAAETSPSQRGSARSAFFSSMQPGPTSPTEAAKTAGKGSSSKGCAVVSSSGSSLCSAPTSSAAASSASGSAVSRPGAEVYYQAVSPTRSRSAFSSIPLPSKPSSTSDAHPEAGNHQGKKVPPPPPPRKSSAKLYGAPLSPNNVNGGGGGEGQGQGQRRDSGSKSPDCGGPAFKPASNPTSSSKGPLSSTPKPYSPPKGGLNKFQKDLAAGIYSNLNRPDLQSQKMVPGRLITDMASPPPAAVTTNSQDPQDEGELSGSESTGSSTSLDSQQGVATILRASTSPSDPHGPQASRGPKPHPPQRHSSLSSKGPALVYEDPRVVKAQGLSLSSSSSSQQDKGARKASQKEEAGKAKSGGSERNPQVNGLYGSKNGHKT